MILWTITVAAVLSGNAMAYIGPGSGMEFFGSAMSLLALVGVAFLSILMWPFYTFMRWLRGTKPAVNNESATEVPSDNCAAADVNSPSPATSGKAGAAPVTTETGAAHSSPQ
jgi:hypothetical protein